MDEERKEIARYGFIPVRKPPTPNTKVSHINGMAKLMTRLHEGLENNVTVDGVAGYLRELMDADADAKLDDYSDAMLMQIKSLELMFAHYMKQGLESPMHADSYHDRAFKVHQLMVSALKVQTKLDRKSKITKDYERTRLYFEKNALDR